MLRFMLPAAGREISEEEGALSLMPSSTMLKGFLAEAVWTSSSDCSRCHQHLQMLYVKD
jgi:hypothetical protein